jgi:N-acetylglucosaminyldiphosphoundecaprenol N-acetyl-beta-D-mannosaminyltransferase
MEPTALAGPGTAETRIPLREKHTCRRAAVNVLGVDVAPLTMERTLAKIAAMLERREKGYLCAINVFGVMEAHRDPGLAAAYADASITIADGMPIAWVGRLQGHRAMERVAGPDLMREVLLRPALARYTHFFYGGEEGVADRLAANFRRLGRHCKIVGTWTPPFRDLTEAEERWLIAKVNRCKPDMIWVGIGTPKQDKFMHRYLSKFDTKLMFGVGAAFDFHTGRIRDCAPWVKRAGLQWLHRLVQEPGRLSGRYLRSNPAFLWNIALQLTGACHYAPPPRDRPAAALEHPPEVQRFASPPSCAADDWAC